MQQVRHIYNTVLNVLIYAFDLKINFNESCQLALHIYSYAYHTKVIFPLKIRTFKYPAVASDS